MRKDPLQRRDNPVHILPGLIAARKEVGEQPLQILLKVLRQKGALPAAQLRQPLFPGVGLAVEGKENVKIGLQEGGRPVVDADRVRAGQGLFQLAVIGGQGLMEKPRLWAITFCRSSGG